MVTAETSRPERRLDLYEVLQVSTSACPEVVHAAYRALARTYHPDVNPGETAARQMRQLNAAYHVLSDPERRARYDSVRVRPMRARRAAPQPVEPVVTSMSDKKGPRSVESVVPPTPIHFEPSRSGGHRVGRVLLAMAFLLLLIGALTFGVLWALEDEPARGMSPSAVGFAVGVLVLVR